MRIACAFISFALAAGVGANTSAMDFRARLTACAKMPEARIRLQCFDALAEDMVGIRGGAQERASGRMTPPSPRPAPPPPDEGDWDTSIETSKMTDQTNVFLSVSSNEPVSCSWASGRRASLHSRCRENTTSIYIHTGCHMVSGSHTTLDRVEYRIDNQTKHTITMRESNNNESLGLWSGGRAIPLVKRLLKGKRLLMRMTPYNENAMELSFNIDGLDNAIGPLRDACHW